MRAMNSKVLAIIVIKFSISTTDGEKVTDGAEVASRRPTAPWHDRAVISGMLTGYQGRGETEAADLARMRRLAESEPDPWARSLPLHFTASALVVHPDSGRVLLRWHQRQGMWLQAGGHGDPGETDPLAIALREAAEETGLPDLVPWPDGTLRHAVVCQVAPGKGEPAHEHADLRFTLATRAPGAARPENSGAPLRWLTIAGARDLVGTNNLRYTLDRVEPLLALSSDAAHAAGGRLGRCRRRSRGTADGRASSVRRPGMRLVAAVRRPVEAHRSPGRDPSGARDGQCEPRHSSALIRHSL